MPTLQYFNSRGRAEPVRLCYALKGVSWSEQHVGVEITDMHTNKENFPYGQVPRLVDDDGTSVLQSLAILRHVGRSLDLYGSTPQEMARVDELLDGLEDMRAKTKVLIYGDKLSDDGFKKYASTVLAPPPLPAASTGGSVMAIFEFLVEKAFSSGQDTYCASGLTLADIQLFNMVDIHLPLFPVHMAAFPTLLALHKSVGAIPEIAACECRSGGLYCYLPTS
eukprot:COSAG05_NODE_35_length_27765_cov_221.324719_17_plen_222_part_00